MATKVQASHVDVAPGQAVILLNGNDTDGATAILKNITGTAPVYLGADDVTAASGFRWDPADGAMESILESGEILYAILAGGAAPQTVHVLATN